MPEMFDLGSGLNPSRSATQSPIERQTSDGTVTILTTTGPLATKTIWWRPHPSPQDDSVGGEWVIRPYGNAKTFSIAVRNVGTIYELAAVLAEIEQDPRSFIVRGQPAEGVDLAHAYRRLHPRTRPDGTVEPATLRAAARHWVPLDIDSIPCPEWLDPVQQPDQSVVEYVVSQLPEEFHGATCWWSFTSGQGIKTGIRLRLFFWADRALEDWELKAWLGERVPQDGVPEARWKLRYPVDPAIFAPAQPIYIARPIFVGVPDPVPFRSGIWRGGRDAITPPMITNPEVAATREPSDRQSSSTYFGSGYETNRSRIGSHEGGGYEAHRSRIGDHEGGDGFHGPIKAAVAAYIARHGASVETQWLRADLERAIRGAPRDPQKHDDAYIEFRVHDLDTLILAIVHLQVTKEAGGRQFLECEPAYPAPLASVEEAREQLVRIFDEHLSSISAYAAAKRAYEAALK
jgi:hypothetical protein